MGSILAIDYGLKRVGLAISDQDRLFAFPYKVLENKNFNYLLEKIKVIINEKDINLIIVGMPYNQRSKIRDRGSEKNVMEKLICEFIERLKKATGIPTEIVDERLSSFTAEENLKERGLSARKLKKFVDEEAARLLLDEFIQKIKQNSK